MQTKVLEAHHIYRSYGKNLARREVLKDFSFSLSSGEFVALMGASGSGKSTFLHLAAGLLVPDSGSIKIGDTIISELSDTKATLFRRRNIGVVFQAFNLIESLNVFENIILPAKLDHSKIDCGRAEELMKELYLEGMGQRNVGELSGGERQRVAIARALYMKPAILLADEPTGNLDQNSAAQIREILVRINKQEKCSILLVTHDPIMASSASRVCFLKDGSIAKTLEDAHSAEEISYTYLELTE